MILYHGTCEYIAKMILSDGKIKKSSPELSIYSGCGDTKFETTPGYVYLSNNIDKARRLGRNSAMKYMDIINKKNLDRDNIKVCWVFEIDIDISKLEPDTDQCKVVEDTIEICEECNIDSCLEKTHCVKYPDDLIIGKDVKRYRKYTNANIGELIEDWFDLRMERQGD